MTTFGEGAAVVVGVATAAAGKSAKVGDDSVAAVGADDDEPDGAADRLGAATSLRAGVEADDVGAGEDSEVGVDGRAVLVVEPVAAPLRGTRRPPVPFVDVPPVDLGFPAELVDPPGDPVVVVEPDPVVSAPPVPEGPGGSDAVGEPPETSPLPAPAAPPDGDVPADDPVSGESVCVVVPDAESPDPVVSAEAIGSVEAIAAPTPRATASAPTRPT
ncbi:hypothetical protein [Mycobacterium sp. OAE908]|uniref:hypothetical protein n=1 Tax=Mycobacterium sp. OAE908 TaxID=2817899 RepID=UPI001AE8DBD4